MTDGEYFEQLWREHSERIERLAKMCTGTARAARGLLLEERNDLMQDVQIKAWRRFHRFLIRPTNFLGWVNRIMVRTWIDTINRRKATVSIDITGDHDFEEEKESVSDSVADPRDDHGQTDDILAIAGELAKTDPLFAAQLVLRTGYGYTIDEAAPALGMSPAQLKSTLDRRKRAALGATGRRRARSKDLGKDGL